MVTYKQVHRPDHHGNTETRIACAQKCGHSNKNDLTERQYGPVGVGPTIGHAEDARAGVLQLRGDLVIEFACGGTRLLHFRAAFAARMLPSGAGK